MSDNNVLHLVDHASIGVDGHDGLMDWAQSWLDAFKERGYGKFRSMIVLVETDDGQLAAISQSSGQLDGTRLTGLLYSAAHRRADGQLNIERIKE